MKKLLSILLVAVLLLSLSATVFASSEPAPNLIVRNATYNKTYTCYRIFAGYSNGSTGISYYTDAAHKTLIDTMNEAADPTCPFTVSTVLEADKGYQVFLKEGKTAANVVSWLQEDAPTSTPESPKKNYEEFAVGSPINMTVANGQATATVLPGYYYVTTTLGTAVAMDTVFDTTNPVIIYDKNATSPEGITKLITKENNVELLDDENNVGVESNDAAVGSIEEFTLTFKAVNYVNPSDSSDLDAYTPLKITKWEVVDTPTNLQVVLPSTDDYKDNVKVYVTTAGTETQLAKTAYSVEVTADGVLKVKIPWVNAEGSHIYSPAASGDDIVHIPVRIVYEAEVKEGAATAPAPNVANATYTWIDPALYDGNGYPVDPDNETDSSHPTSPYDSTDPENPVPVIVNSFGKTDLTPDNTVTYTYAFDLIKTDAAASALNGAQFQLGNMVAGVFTPLTFVVDGTVYRIPTVEELADVAVTKVTTISPNNTATIRGLDKGTYLLKEIKAPDGYNILEDPITVLPTDSTETEGRKVLTKIANGPKVNEDDPATVDPGDLTVVNQVGTELPETGGVGTTLFYIFGAILFLGAGAVLIARRKVADR